MSSVEPLPFRITVPDKDTIDLTGIRSVSYRVEGLLHLAEDTLIFEWSATETTERVGFTGIGTVVDESPVGKLEVPASWIADARLRGGWWRPQLVLRARRLGAFESMPGVTGGALILRIDRQLRREAKTFVAAIELARKQAPLLPEPPEHDDTEVPRLHHGDEP